MLLSSPSFSLASCCEWMISFDREEKQHKNPDFGHLISSNLNLGDSDEYKQQMWHYLLGNQHLKSPSAGKYGQYPMSLVSEMDLSRPT